jgi:ubiquinone/menaquinone biosynthesis C-methylase UbiE
MHCLDQATPVATVGACFDREGRDERWCIVHFAVIARKPPSSGVDARYRARIFVFLLGAVLLFVGLSVVYQGVATLESLKIVEGERDGWQRPGDVIEALDLDEGSSVVDLGCGARYFTLELSRTVGDRGDIIAVNVRTLPLIFLRIRALLQRRWNITIVRGEPNDPQLPLGTVDAILIANTYHELTNRDMILAQTFRSLRSGGRLVIVDRGPEEAVEAGARSGHHEVPLAMAETHLLKHGFEIVSRVGRFIDRPPDEPWWLVVARKP